MERAASFISVCAQRFLKGRISFTAPLVNSISVINKWKCEIILSINIYRHFREHAFSLIVCQGRGEEGGSARTKQFYSPPCGASEPASGPEVPVVVSNPILRWWIESWKIQNVRAQYGWLMVWPLVKAITGGGKLQFSSGIRGRVGGRSVRRQQVFIGAWLMGH